MKNIYFTSDTHYAHKNICRGITGWEENVGEQKTRDFRTLDEMNDTIVNSINGMVKENDILYHLGDWSFGGIDNIWNFRKQIKCRNIHLIYGNHDHHIEANRMLTISEYAIVPAHKIFSSVQYYKEIKVAGQMIVLSHYAHRVWNHSHKGAIHLYGHSHASLENVEWGRSMDVGIDNAFILFGEYRPISIDEVLSIMKNKTSLIIDHHNEKTN